MRYLGLSLGTGVALGLLRGFRHAGAADFQGADAELFCLRQQRQHCRTCQIHLRTGNSGGRWRLHGGHRHRGTGGLHERNANAGGTKEEVHQGIQFQERHSGGDVLRHHERVLRLCPAGRQKHQRCLARRRDRYLWTGLPTLAGLVARRFHYQFHLVRLVELQERHRLSIPRLPRPTGARPSRWHRQRARPDGGRREQTPASWI